MAENNSDNQESKEINYEELANSLQNSLQSQRRDLIDKNSKIVDLEKKIVAIEKDCQQKLMQFDEMLTQVNSTQQKTDLILKQERMHYQEQSTNQYFEFLHAENKIKELDTENGNLLHHINQLNSKLESEVNKLSMMKNAYSGVFEAFIKNFIKLYSVLGHSTDFLETTSTDYESKIEQLFINFPELTKVVDRLKKSNSSIKELESHLDNIKVEVEVLKTKNTALITENKELKEKLTQTDSIIESNP